MGDVVVHRADDAVFEQGVAAAKDEINVTCDLTVGVVLGGRFAGRKTARAEKAVLLPLLFGQRGAEERVLTAQQLDPAEHRPGAVHIGRDGLPGFRARAGVVFNRHVLHAERFAAEKGGVAAEGMSGPPVLVGQLAAVAPHEFCLICTRPPQGDAALFADQLFPVNAGTDLHQCFLLIGYGQHRLRDGREVAAAVLCNCNCQHMCLSYDRSRY